MPIQVSRRGRCGCAGGGRKHLEFPAGGDQGVKFKFGLEQKQTGMRDMTITHIFETTLRFEREIKAGLGLRRRALQAFPPAAGAPAAPPPAELAGHKANIFALF